MIEGVAEHLVNLHDLQEQDLQLAYLQLVIAAERSGYRTVAKPGRPKRGVEIRTTEDQPFSFIVAKNHILFYLRAPALAQRPELRAEAAVIFPDQFKSAPNSANEATLRLDSFDDAQRLSGWLFGA